MNDENNLQLNIERYMQEGVNFAHLLNTAVTVTDDFVRINEKELRTICALITKVYMEQFHIGNIYSQEVAAAVNKVAMSYLYDYVSSKLNMN